MKTDSSLAPAVPSSEPLPASSFLDHFIKFLVALFVYVLSILLCSFLLRAYAHEGLPIIEWVNLSRQPELGIMALAVMVVSAIYILLSFLIISKITLPGGFEMQINPAHWIRPYARMMLGESVLFLLIANSYLMVIPPVCKPPTIVFKVDTGSETRRYTPQSEVNIPATVGSVVMGIDLTAGQNIKLENLSCTWSVAGSPVDHISPADGCAPTLYFKERKLGDVLLSVKVRNQYCSAVTIYILTIHKE